MKFTDLAEDSEDSGHTPAERIAAATRSTPVSVVVSLALTAAQILAGDLSKSQGLIADGIHSLSDLVADFVVLSASHHSRKDGGRRSPLRPPPFETAASLVLGLLLLAVGVGMLWSAVRKLLDPTWNRAGGPSTARSGSRCSRWSAKELLLFRYMLAVAKRVSSSMLVANAWHARSDAASSLVVGARHHRQPGRLPILDPIAALIVGFMVGRMGWEFTWNALHDLMDRAADDEEVQRSARRCSIRPACSARTTCARARWAT